MKGSFHMVPNRMIRRGFRTTYNPPKLGNYLRTSAMLTCFTLTLLLIKKPLIFCDTKIGPKIDHSMDEEEEKIISIQRPKGKPRLVILGTGWASVGRRR